MNKKEILHVDMDGVLCDIELGYSKAKEQFPQIDFPQSIPGIFESLDPINGCIDAVNRLRDQYDLWILSAPSVRNPHCYSEKRIWIENHFDYDLAKRLILSCNKGLIIGDYLIDDHVDGKGQETFAGEIIHFGSVDYPDWNSVLDRLLT